MILSWAYRDVLATRLFSHSDWDLCFTANNRMTVFLLIGFSEPWFVLWERVMGRTLQSVNQSWIRKVRIRVTNSTPNCNLWYTVTRSCCVYGGIWKAYCIMNFCNLARQLLSFAIVNNYYDWTKKLNRRPFTGKEKRQVKLLHDNARPHVGKPVKDTLMARGWENSTTLGVFTRHSSKWFSLVSENAKRIVWCTIQNI